MTYIHLTETLVDNFYALADEVQSLTDRKTVLEHKLRFAHEQVGLSISPHAHADCFACSSTHTPLPM